MDMPMWADAGDSSDHRRFERTLDALAAAWNSHDSGAPVFTRVYADARQALERSRKRHLAGNPLSPIDGLAVSIKDLFDVGGEPTMAGCRALAGETPAKADALVVQRLRQAGAVIVGKTNMTEFALSGLGLNPTGTPLAPWRRDEGRIAGGSSSGAAVSVADGMAWGALGSDTGGSVRIPAAFCGLVGFKPTAARVSRQGVFALSHSLDSVGPLASCVHDCAALDAIIADQPRDASPSRRKPDRICLAMPSDYVLDELDPEVAIAFERAIERLVLAGVRVHEMPMQVLLQIPALGVSGSLSRIEGWAAHAKLFERVREHCDRRVMNDFLTARSVSAKDYFDKLRLREALIAEADLATAPFDAIVMPTTSMIPPRLSDLDTDEAYLAANRRVLRNPAVANILDRCAITIPCHVPGEAPVGFSLMGKTGDDAALLALAMHIEPILRIAPADQR
jgi:aspartyl-tRNA(Asn)/glutamyl-tRNA(Gln) amidotransferase subunit A